MKTLNAQQENLLRDVLAKRRPDLTRTLDEAKRRDLSNEELRQLCELLTDEFIDTGLEDGARPTERGLQIEALIDVLNPLK